MNKIVREHYPVSKLPEDLRAGFGGVDAARVTVEAETAPSISLTSLLERAARLRQDGRIKPVSEEEAVARIRAQRDGTNM